MSGFFFPCQNLFQYVQCWQWYLPPTYMVRTRDICVCKMSQNLTYRAHMDMDGSTWSMKTTVQLCLSCLQSDLHSGPVHARSQRAPLYSPLLSVIGKTHADHKVLAAPGPLHTSPAAHTALSLLSGGPDKQAEKNKYLIRKKKASENIHQINERWSVNHQIKVLH